MLTRMITTSCFSFMFREADAQILSFSAGLWTRDRPTLLLPRFVSLCWGEGKSHNWIEVWQYETKQNGQLLHCSSNESQGVPLHEKRYAKNLNLLENTYYLFLWDDLKNYFVLSRESWWLEEPFYCGPKWKAWRGLQAENEECYAEVSYRSLESWLMMMQWQRWCYCVMILRQLIRIL